MVTPTLRIVSGPEAGRSIEIDRDFVIGREGEDLTVEDAELSRRHVLLRRVEKGIEVEDLSSLNGTFVDGERIASPTTLTTTATLKFGSSEAKVEIPLSQMTRAADVFAPGAAEVVGTPDVTRQSEMVQPDVTRQRAVADPDVTAQRAVADPDVTAQRAVADPDQTALRPGRAGPPASGPPPARTPPDSGGRPPSGGKVPLLAGVSLLAVIAVVAVILLSGGGDEAAKRQLSLVLNTAPASEKDRRASVTPPGQTAVRWTMTGRVRGKPFATGTVKAFVTLQPIPKPPPGTPAKKPPPGRPKAARVTSRLELSFEGGTIVATESLASRRLSDSVEFTGNGRVLEGTGEFENATGTFKITGGRPKFEKPSERVEWTGTVEY